MNSLIESNPRTAGSIQSEPDMKEVDEVLVSLEADLSGQDENEDDDDHPTWIDIEFPREVGMLHGVTSISLPIREILTWMTSKDPELKERLLAIRDDFYDEDHDDGYEMRDQHQIYDREEVARLRIDRRTRKLKREEERKMAPSTSDLVLSVSSEDRWGANASEGLALEAALRDHWAQSDQLDRKWEQFVVNSRNEELSASWNEVRRNELRLEGSRLDLKFHTLMARMDDLENRCPTPQ